MLAAVMSRLPVKETAPTPELNCQPYGSIRIKVLLFPTAKSDVIVSVRTMLPKAVNPAPLVEFNDLSAEISLPPNGSVTVTSPRVQLGQTHNAPTTSPICNNSRFIPMFLRPLLVSNCRKVRAEKPSASIGTAIDLPACV